MGRSGKGSTTGGWPGWFPRVVTETDTGHEGPERPRGPTGGPLAATDGERRVGRALPRHGHALPTEPAILEFSNSTPLFQLRSSEVLGANVAPRTHGGRRLPGRPPGECAPRSTEAGADAAPRQGARPRAATAAQAPTQRSTKCPTRFGTHKIARCAARTFLRQASQARGAGSSTTTSPENFLW